MLGVILAVAWLLPSAGFAQVPADAAPDVVLRALGLVDTPYRYGGRSPAGFDCSGFVGYVFGESAGLSLPRRADELGRIGAGVGREDLAPGDLVFFNTLGRRYSHVGIYVGDGQFVHAPARRGRVRVERLSDPYWVARYNGARRLEGVGGAQVAAAVPVPSAALAAESLLDLRITP